MTADGCEKYVDKGENRILLIKRDSHFYRFDNVISMTFMVILMGTKVLKKMEMDLNCGLKKGRVVLLSITSILDFLIQN